LILGRMSNLEIINDHFSRLLRNSLSTALRKVIEVNSRGIQLMKFGEFIKTLPVPSSIHVFKMEPLRGHAILVLESKLVFNLLDVFFGGSGKTHFSIEARDFTAIESRMIHKVVTMIFNNFEKAWNVIHPIKVQYIRSEMNPRFVRIVPTGEPVLTFPFGVEFEQFTGVVTFCIPYSIIEHIKAKLHSGRGKLYSGYQSDQPEVDRGWVEGLLDRLKYAEVEVKVELGRRQIMIHELLRLKVGDVLSLEKDIMEPLVVRIQGIPKFLGKAGVYGNNQAVQVEGRINSF